MREKEKEKEGKGKSESVSERERESESERERVRGDEEPLDAFDTDSQATLKETDLKSVFPSMKVEN